jgi:hypothetical protein
MRGVDKSKLYTSRTLEILTPHCFCINSEVLGDPHISLPKNPRKHLLCFFGHPRKRKLVRGPPAQQLGYFLIGLSPGL